MPSVRFITHTLLASLTLCGLAACAAPGKPAMPSHGMTSPGSRCQDISQPAQIHCAAAPSSLFDKQGRLWTAWAYAGHVYVNHSDDFGQTFSPAVAVNRVAEKISARGENRPKIQLNEQGHLFVSWTMPLEKRFTGHVRFSVSTDGGRHFSDPVIVNDNREITGHRFDALGVNSEGLIYMAWIDKRDRLAHSRNKQPYHGAAIYYTWSDDGGKSFKPNQKIIDHSCECCRVVIDFDQRKLPVILWRNIYGKNIRDHALVRFADHGKPLPPERVSHDQWAIDACPHHGPDMSINAQNDFHLAWFNNAEKRHGLFYARRNGADQAYTPTIPFGDYAQNASHPQVIHLNNEVWLAWKQFDGKRESIWIQHSSDNGTRWSGARQLADTAQSSDHPLLIKHNDRIYLQWQTQAEGYRLLAVN